jgi:hypothetical protein
MSGYRTSVRLFFNETFFFEGDLPDARLIDRGKLRMGTVNEPCRCLRHFHLSPFTYLHL